MSSVDAPLSAAEWTEVELGQLAPGADERLLVGAYVEYVRSRPFVPYRRSHA